jgi:phage protein D
LIVAEKRKFDTLVPEVDLRINGKELSQNAVSDLVSVTVLEDVNAAGMFTITLLCWDNKEMRVIWIDDDRFKEGNIVEIDMGYRDNMKTLFKGEITGLEPEFPKDESPKLTVTGYDRRHRLMGKRKSRTFLNMKDSEIANQVAADWSLTPKIADTHVTLDYVLQNNQSDFEFLQERARRIGHEMVVTDAELHFRPRKNDGSSVLKLNREVELLDFSARLTTMGQVEEVNVQGWNAKDKKEVVAKSRIGDERQMGGSASGPAATRRAFSGTGGTAVDTPVLNQAEADQLAQGWFGEMALAYVEGFGTCIGDPELRAGTLVEIEGLGKRFSGSYYVTSTEHSYKPSIGYRTAFSVRRNAT